MPTERQTPQSDFSVVFEKLEELQDSNEAKESTALAAEAEEIQELRRIIEETNAADCLEFTST